MERFIRIIPAIDDLVPGLRYIYDTDGTTDQEAQHLRPFLKAAEDGYRIIDLWVPAEAGTDDVGSLVENDHVLVMEIVDDRSIINDMPAWYKENNPEELYVEAVLLQ